MFALHLCNLQRADNRTTERNRPPHIARASLTQPVQAGFDRQRWRSLHTRDGNVRIASVQRRIHARTE